MRLSNCPALRLAIATVASLAWSGAGGAESNPAPVRVTLLDSRFVVGSERFTDAAAVAAWVRSRDVRVVGIDRCGAADTPQLLAAVERFAPRAPATLEIRALPGDAATCAAASANPPEEFIGFLRASDYLVTDEQGRSAIP